MLGFGAQSRAALLMVRLRNDFKTDFRRKAQPEVSLLEVRPKV
jgi:hypothetical protein